MNCPCNSGELYKSCCALYHNKSAYPPTAEKLMRSRYSAYVLKNEKYLLYTWQTSKRPPSLALNSVRWTGLEILSIKDGLESDTTGVVEFVAKYSLGNQDGKVHEISNFLKENNKWFYVDGTIQNEK